MTLYAWLIGPLVGMAALGLGYALLSLGQLVLARTRALSATGRRTTLLARYYQPWRLAAVAWPAPLVALWALLRHASPLTFAPSAGGLLVAGLARDPVFSPYLALVGAGMTLYLVYRGTLRAQQTQSDTVRRLLDAFVGLYRVNPTTFATLALATT